ncbi:hypothetical protein [Nakamurella aerolata]|uniref:Host cell surface-exposed lipoprotein n=1 Tax=Nakamurella aerolata TaxID=1656892 RepID=A0A849A9P5_9ACTN|nr:hypothetical protein [Nakamurella aerolata]NNG37654.1 hypothetical protein [Nakamurella aerolata]
MTSLPSKALRRRRAVAGVCATLTLLASACTSTSDATGTTERSYPPANPSVFGSSVGPTGTEPLFPRSSNHDAPSSSTPPAKSHKSSGETPAGSAQSYRTTATPPSTSRKASPGTPSTKSSTSSRPSLDGPPASADDVQTTGPGGAPVVLAAPEGPISDSEAKNRREIETAWLNMWQLYAVIDTIPVDQLRDRFSKYSYGPALEEYVATGKAAAERGIANDGGISLALSW